MRNMTKKTEKFVKKWKKWKLITKKFDVNIFCSKIKPRKQYIDAEEFANFLNTVRHMHIHICTPTDYLYLYQYA